MKEATRRYVIHFSLAMTAYVIAVLASVFIVGAMDESSIWRYPVVLLPMLPALYALRTFLVYLNSVDELIQRMQLNAIAVAAGLTGMITFSIGFLEGVGFPRLSWTLIFPMMIVFWGIALRVIERRYR